MTAMRLPGPYSDLCATVEVPASKSLTNRALVAAAVADGGEIRNPLESEDTRLLAEALATAGWSVQWGEEIRIGPRTAHDAAPTLWLGNSGTGARLLLGLLAASPGGYVVDGTPRLRERPMGPLLEALTDLGARVDSPSGGLPVSVEGVLMDGGSVRIRPKMSSQFVSSLLLAAPLMRNGLDLVVEGELPSRPYVDLTLDVLAEVGVQVEQQAGDRRWRVRSGGARPTTMTIEGDWSAAAFPAAAAAVAGGSVAVEPLSIESRQGDRKVCGVLAEGGVEVESTPDRVVFRGPAGRPIEADLRDTPDLFPALAVVAAVVPGSTLTGLDHLRHKESDRLSVMIANLQRLGCEIDAGGSEFRVLKGLAPSTEREGQVTAADDHRIAMAMAVAALVTGPIELDDPDCVAKSFPGFWDTWRDLLEQSGRRRPVP
jgi:3-phosphoshikimate 1-carboxyvinyltransferase